MAVTTDVFHIVGVSHNGDRERARDEKSCWRLKRWKDVTIMNEINYAKFCFCVIHNWHEKISLFVLKVLLRGRDIFNRNATNSYTLLTKRISLHWSYYALKSERGYLFIFKRFSLLSIFITPLSVSLRWDDDGKRYILDTHHQEHTRSDTFT